MPRDARISPLRHPRNALYATLSTLRHRLRKGPLLPSWSFRTEWAVRLLKKDWEDLCDYPPNEFRTHLDRIPASRKLASQIEQKPVSMGSVPGACFVPRRATSDAVLLYLHGGGYVSGSLKTHHDTIARFALATGARTLAIEYRLAPEHPYPAQLEDALAAYRALLAEGVEPHRLVVGGESAGGHLTLSLLIALRDAGEALPAAAILISPWADLESKSESIRTNAPYDYGNREMLLFMARSFCGKLDPTDTRVSLLHADLAGLPPLLIQVGGAEMLHDEVEALAERARKAGVRVTLEVLHEMPHAPPLLADFAPEGERAVEHAATFFKEQIK